MKNFQLDYTNEYEVRNYINTVVVAQIEEDLEQYPADTQDDYIFEVIEGLSDVIYNYQAQKVAEAFGLSPFDESEFTGERFNSYNEMAMEAIYNAWNNEVN
jgi:hypothetical protein